MGSPSHQSFFAPRSLYYSEHSDTVAEMQPVVCFPVPVVKPMQPEPGATPSSSPAVIAAEKNLNTQIDNVLAQWEKSKAKARRLQVLRK